MFFYDNVLMPEEPTYAEFKNQQELKAVWESIPGEAFLIAKAGGPQVGTCKDVGNSICIIYSCFDCAYFLETGMYLDRLRDAGYTVGAYAKTVYVKKPAESAG